MKNNPISIEVGHHEWQLVSAGRLKLYYDNQFSMRIVSEPVTKIHFHVSALSGLSQWVCKLQTLS